MKEQGKLLYGIDVDGMKTTTGNQIKVGVYGIFSCIPGVGRWRYYLISYHINNQLSLTDHWHNYNIANPSLEDVRNRSKEVNSVEEGIKLCDDFKTKWVTGSNNTIQENRDNKIVKILN